MMWYWGGGLHWWGWLLGSFGMVVFWGLIIFGVWYAVTALARATRHHPHGDDGARDVLDRRLARGEIDPDEYRRLRDLIDHDERFSGHTGGRR